MADKIVSFSKDANALTAELIRSKLVAKFGTDKIRSVKVDSRGDIHIHADLTTQQWNGVAGKLQGKGYEIVDIDDL